ncbi:MAG: redox-sensing transcriptional repressor Rex [Planctomycetota bacterium]|nr:redox-sensing transcriptional repressor Rex [Planctomycetota bacterium]
MKNEKSKTDIPKPTVARLPNYRQALQHFLAGGTSVISSHDLAHEAAVTPSQLRKDLAYFGHFGTAGIGYDVRKLLDTLEEILGTARKRPVVLVGVGNLGRAVLNHSSLAQAGFDIVASVDDSPRKHGRVIVGVRCYPGDELEV